MLDKREFKVNSINRDKEGYYLLLKILLYFIIMNNLVRKLYISSF